MTIEKWRNAIAKFVRMLKRVTGTAEKEGWRWFHPHFFSRIILINLWIKYEILFWISYFLKMSEEIPAS